MSQISGTATVKLQPTEKIISNLVPNQNKIIHQNEIKKENSDSNVEENNIEQNDKNEKNTLSSQVKQEIHMIKTMEKIISNPVRDQNEQFHQIDIKKEVNT